MTEIATIDWFGRWGTSVFSENIAIFFFARPHKRKRNKFASAHKRKRNKNMWMSLK